MKTYLSIDLDFWSFLRTPRQAEHLIQTLFQKKMSRIPKVFVESHEELLAHIPEGTERVINIDYHSDFKNYTEDPRLLGIKENCGNWVDYVPGLKAYEWRYPNYKECFEEHRGRCDELERYKKYCNAYCDCYWCASNRYSKEAWKGEFSSRGVKTSHQQGLKNLDFQELVGIGFAKSEEYWENKYFCIDYLVNLLRDRGCELKKDPLNLDWC